MSHGLVADDTVVAFGVGGLSSVASLLLGNGEVPGLSLLTFSGFGAGKANFTGAGTGVVESIGGLSGVSPVFAVETDLEGGVSFGESPDDSGGNVRHLTQKHDSLQSKIELT